ncbi:manganese efflux pump MntP family protein [Dethiosulfovibrio peptidovorans]|nr:manganese efflux pump MntP family protein [Dethiosulfovibrio peptidovorans]
MAEMDVVVATASALAMDAFSVSLGAGACRCGMPVRQILRMASIFGFFQFAMPLLGGVLGATAVSFVSAWDHWIAAGLLWFVGGNMIFESIKPDKDCSGLDTAKTRVLLGLAVATSIDAMAVGFSTATLGDSVMPLALVAGVITYLLSVFGAMAGCRLGSATGHRAEMLGGLCLCLIGLEILASHMNWI